MKKTFIYIALLSAILFSQDNRSTIFSTGTPDTEEGYVISGDISFADRFAVSSNYAMEAFKVTIARESMTGTVTVSIHQDNNNTPGNILGSWDLALTTTDLRDYLVYTFEDCILFDQNQTYWLSVKAADPLTIAKWIYSPANFYTYSESSDNQLSWENSTGFAGTAKIYAEAFYEPDPLYGDLNLDNQINVLDIVTMVSHIVGNSEITDEAFNLGDINSDGALDILDIVHRESIEDNPIGSQEESRSKITL